MIRVGKCNITSSGKLSYTKIKNFIPVIIMTKSRSKYYPLSPYYLTDANGRIFENVWQFSKIYPQIYQCKQYRSRYDNTVIWQQDFETHVQDTLNDEHRYLTPEYFQWRERGLNTLEAIRYPNGFNKRHECIGAICQSSIDNKIIDTTYDIKKDTQSLVLSYIDSRKSIYLPLYSELVSQQPLFKKLQQKLQAGKNLLIIEIDGPHQESLPYYQQTYYVDDSFIENNSILATENNLSIMLNDSKHCFGHGYCLAWALNGYNF